MKKIFKRLLIFLGFVLLAAFAALTLGRTFILDKVRSRFEAQLHKLRDAGYLVEYDSITIDWKKNTVEVYELAIRNNLDSAYCRNTDFIYAKYIRAEDFRILPLILRKQLSFGTIVVDSPHVIVNERFLRLDSIKRSRKEFTLMIGHVKLPRLHFEVYDSKTCRTGSLYDANAMLDNFRLAFYEDRQMLVDTDVFNADSITINLREDLYTITVKNISFKPPLKLFDLDTMRITPHYGKIAFGKKGGIETDRIEGLVPYINIYGLTLDRTDSLTLTAQKLTTQIFFRVFRDKRLPFRSKYKRLPVDALQNLPIGVNIASVVLNKSFVEYEEFADEADSSGSVYFDELYATIKNVNNTEINKKGHTDLIAEALFMGVGKVKVHAEMPLDDRKWQKISGSVSDLPMKSLNQMIEPAIQVRAESGYLNRLNFEFACNDIRSKGTLEMNYRDLKLMTFKNENRIEKIRKRKKRKNEPDDDEKVRKAAFKSFIVNNFIIRRNMDKDVPEEKRTGTIDFERHRQKSVFNFWWKSLLSGVKSAYKLEKIEDSKITRMLQKKDKGQP